MLMFSSQVQRSISDQERPRADSEQMMSALGLDPDLYKVITMTMIWRRLPFTNTIKDKKFMKQTIDMWRCSWWWWWLKRIFMTMPATLILRVTLVEKKDFLTIILEEFILTFGKVFFSIQKICFNLFDSFLSLSCSGTTTFARPLLCGFST